MSISVATRRKHWWNYAFRGVRITTSPRFSVLVGILFIQTLFCQDFYDKGLIPTNLVKKASTARSGCPTYSYHDPQTSNVIVFDEMYQDGKQIKVRTFYKNGEKHGVEQTWWTNGQLISEDRYNLGVLDGDFKRWDENGNLLDRSNIKNGKGVYYKYLPNGSIQFVRRLNIGNTNDITEEYYEYFSKWKFRSVKRFKNGKANGVCEEYFPNEKLQSRKTFENGKMNGVSAEFHQNGNVSSYTNFLDDKSEGPSIGYYDGGELRTITYTRNGKSHGIYIHFSKGGDITSLFYYLNGEKVDAPEYKQASKEDSSLPKYKQDPNAYRALEKDVLAYYAAKGWRKGFNEVTLELLRKVNVAYKNKDSKTIKEFSDGIDRQWKEFIVYNPNFWDKYVFQDVAEFYYHRGDYEESFRINKSIRKGAGHPRPEVFFIATLSGYEVKEYQSSANAAVKLMSFPEPEVDNLKQNEAFLKAAALSNFKIGDYKEARIFFEKLRERNWSKELNYLAEKGIQDCDAVIKASKEPTK
jgi:antitoxin component YwqK of YwqJK toxin-antitoxin module